MSLKISYNSECDTDYIKAVRNCKTLDELKNIVEEYRELTEDAYQIVQNMDNLLFEQFCKGRKKFKPSEKWMKMYGPVIFPRLILEIGLTATSFKVPFGTAYHRFKQMGKIP